jgi:stage V sporulation protein SpoVS
MPEEPMTIVGQLELLTPPVVDGAVAAMMREESFLSELFERDELQAIARAAIAGALEAARG